MAFKILLDANVVLDFMLKRKNYVQTKDVFQSIIGGQARGFITPSILQISAYWLTKAYGRAKAGKLLLILLENISIIDINHDAAVLALNSQMTDIEDALQYYTALYHKLDCCISSDKGFQKSAIPTLPVYSPADYLKRM